MSKERILFLCTGNSCRSQMAEGIVNHFYGEEYEAFSAGVKPSVVNPRAIAVMQELGIDISQQTSKHLKEFIGQEFSYIITVCDNAKVSCPIFPGNAERLHWSFEDPAEAEGTEDEIMDEFRRIRDQILIRIKYALLEEADAEIEFDDSDIDGGIMNIKVLGSGCTKCKKLEDNVLKAVAEMGLDARTEKVTDLQQIMGYGVMMTPALVINEEVKSVGKLLSVDDVKKILNGFK